MEGITDREKMIQHMVRAYFHRRPLETLKQPLSDDELAETLVTLNQRWKAPGDMEIGAEMVQEARKQALEERRNDEES